MRPITKKLLANKLSLLIQIQINSLDILDVREILDKGILVVPEIPDKKGILAVQERWAKRDEIPLKSVELPSNSLYI